MCILCLLMCVYVHVGIIVWVHDKRNTQNLQYNIQ